MGLLTPKGKKGDKKNGASNAKATGAAPSASKFMNKGIKASGGFVKKGTTGGSQRGS